jgi:hypothetical protein
MTPRITLIILAAKPKFDHNPNIRLTSCNHIESACLRLSWFVLSLSDGTELSVPDYTQAWQVLFHPQILNELRLGQMAYQSNCIHKLQCMSID